MRTILFLLFATSPFLTIAQKDTVIYKHLDTFERRAEVFDRWLDAVGLNPILKVEYPRLRPDDPNELELLLLIRADSAEQAFKLWQKTVKSFQAQTGRSINEELYRTFTNIMEIPPEQGNIQIHVRYPSGDYSNYFFVWIWQDSQTNRIVDSVYYTHNKSYSFNFEIPDVKIKKNKPQGEVAGYYKKTLP